jgi:hypothetical protein
MENPKKPGKDQIFQPPNRLPQPSKSPEIHPPKNDTTFVATKVAGKTSKKTNFTRNRINTFAYLPVGKLINL